MSPYRIKKNENSSRLDRLIKSAFDLSFSMNEIRRHIEAGSCQVNARITFKPSLKVKTGDLVSYEPPQLSVQNFEILFQDDFFSVLNKPNGVAISNTADLQKNTQALDCGPLLLAHRLDKETSGVLLTARTEEALSKAMKLFRNRQIQKTYTALVQGKWKKNEGKIETQHGKKRVKGRQIWGAVPNGQEAITDYKTLKTNGDISLVEFYPLTGRTHQLRVHASEGDHPILGDAIYGKKLKKLSSGRLMLHASQISFTHPFTNDPLTVESELPEAFKKIIKKEKLKVISS